MRFFLIPISMLLVKYYPISDAATMYGPGVRSTPGITTNKNALGYLCMVFGFFFVWRFIIVLRTESKHEAAK